MKHNKKLQPISHSSPPLTPVAMPSPLFFIIKFLEKMDATPSIGVNLLPFPPPLPPSPCQQQSAPCGHQSLLILHQWAFLQSISCF